MKALPLSKNFVVVVDDEDGDLLETRWRPVTDKWGCSYAVASMNGKTVYMHRVILSRVANRDLERHEQVDHINRNGMDNRRENLRIATSSQNQCNAKCRADSKTGYKGVQKSRNRWMARIKINGKRYYLGTFNTPQAAHEAYKQKAVELFGEFARFN